MDFARLKDEVRRLAGITLDDTDAGVLVNQKYLEMCARAEFNMQETEFGPTVAGQERYNLADTVVDLQALLVNGTPFDRISPNTLFALKSGASRLGRFSPGAFSAAFGAEGVEQIALYPVPEATGQAMMGLISADITTLTGTQTPIVPAHLHGYIRDGAIGTGLAMLEERLDSAAAFNTQFEFGVELLGRWKNSRVGGGPVRAKLSGLHF